MKLPKFIRWMMFNPITIAKNIIYAKEINKQNLLLKEYEAGRILQVDNGKDNKQFLLKLETA